MSLGRTAAAGLLLALLAAPAAADEPDTRVLVPSVARLAGAHGTQWRSTLVLHNPGGAPVTVDVALLERGHANPDPATVRLEVPGRGSLLVADVLADLYGAAAGAGALVLQASGPVVASSRTFTSVAAAHGGASTFGQHVPGQPVAPFAGARQHLLPMLTATPAFRTNLGFVNLGYDELLAWTVPIAFGPEAPKARMLITPAHATSQVDGLLAETGTPLPDAMLWIETDFLSGPFLAWASVIDNGTGDAIFVPPVLPVAGPVAVLGAAHVGGVAGTSWRTDLEVVGDPFLPVEYRLEWLPADRDNRSPAVAEYALAPREARRHVDVVRTAFGATGAGAIRVVPTRGEPLVSARTFNRTALGSYGQYVPALAMAAAAGPGDTALVVHLRETAAYRTNLGLLNTSEVPITVSIRPFGADGLPIGSVHAELEPLAFHQLDRILRRVSDHPVEVAAAHLSTATPGGSFLAYASVVDNASGDPIFVPAVRLEHATR